MLLCRRSCRVLRPGGRFLCLEFSKVVVPGMQQLYDLYSFNVIPQIGRWAERCAADRHAGMAAEAAWHVCWSSVVHALLGIWIARHPSAPSTALAARATARGLGMHPSPLLQGCCQRCRQLPVPGGKHTHVSRPGVVVAGECAGTFLRSCADLFVAVLLLFELCGQL